MPGIDPVGLGVPPPPAQPRHLGRLGQVRHHARGLALLDHEPPPGAALHRQLHVLAGQFRQPAAEQLPIRRADPAPAHLAGDGVQHIERDLLPVQIQPAYDRHRDLLEHHQKPRSGSQRDR